MTELVDAAHADSTVQHAATSYPKLRRDAHLSRVSGTVCWALVVDGLVDAAKQGRFPDGFSVNTTEPQHNAGRYAFAFPAGVFAVRREPHDDSKDRGRFLQQSFKQVTKLMDEQGSPSAQTAVRVWIRIAPEGKTKLTARDRHDHKIVITLSDLQEISTPQTIWQPTSDTRKTKVRSILKPEQDSAAE